MKEGFTTTENGTPILIEPFTHEQVDGYYGVMYDHVAELPEPAFDLRTLEAVHNFFEFEANSGMMLDAWLHAQIQKVTGKSYTAAKKPKEHGW
jgi:hypothetical protein